MSVEHYLPEILCSMTVADSWRLVVQNGCTIHRDSPKLRFIPSRSWLPNLLAHYCHLPHSKCSEMRKKRLDIFRHYFLSFCQNSYLVQWTDFSPEELQYNTLSSKYSKQKDYIKFVIECFCFDVQLCV